MATQTSIKAAATTSVKCSKCGADTTSVQYRVWVNHEAWRDENDRLCVMGQGEVLWEASEPERIWCGHCAKESAITEEINWV